MRIWNKAIRVLGRAIAQAISRWLPTVATRVRAQVRPCGICGGQSGAVAGFLRVLQFLLTFLIPPTAPHSSSSITRDWYKGQLMADVLIAVAARSRALTVFSRSNSGIVGSNPAQGMGVCVRLFCVCVVLCVGSGLTTGWYPVQGVLSTVYRIKKLKSGQGPTKGCRATDR
jgi:hypothetical protein